MIRLIKISLLLFALSIVSCEESNDTDFANIDRDFVLFFDTTVDFDGSEQTTVFFETSDTTDFPTVTINGEIIGQSVCTFDNCQPIPTEYLDKFNDVLISAIYGYQKIPTESVFKFSISKNGFTISGQIEKPERPNSVKCNDEIINQQTLEIQSDTIEQSDYYNFYWECGNYDYFSIDLITTVDKIESVNNQYTLADMGYSIIKVDLTSNIGFDYFDMNYEPNYKGEYGNGYVLSSNTTNLNYLKIGK